MKQPVDLSLENSDYAVFLPAISTFYSTYISKQRYEEFVSQDRIPEGFDRGIEGMNFLNPTEGYFTYKYGLYSAGHACLDINKTIKKDSMIQERDREHCTIVGDSGGFQIGKNIIKFDWQDFTGKSANKTRLDILNWLELTADWSMTLDVPTWACDHNHSHRTGLKSVEECLEKTIINNDFFIKNRLGQTKFLNVLQGLNWQSAEEWYQGVKPFSDPNGPYGDNCFEGWAFGGANMCKMPIALRRLMVMKYDGMLNNKNWIHFLGTAQLDWSCYLTAIQRQIREHINPDVVVSFDCASPFIATAHGLVYTNAQFLSNRLSVIMDKAPDNKKLAGDVGKLIRFPFESEIASRLTMSDVCYYKPGDKNKIGKEGKTSWDSFAYALMMCHNVYCHIKAVQRANQLYDVERHRISPNWRNWRKTSKKDTYEYSEWVPKNILYFDNFIKELFERETLEESFSLIEEAEHFLTNLEGKRLRGGVRNEFHKFFIENDQESNDWENDRFDESLDKLKADH